MFINTEQPPVQLLVNTNINGQADLLMFRNLTDVLADAIMSIWTKTSEEVFQHVVESMQLRTEVKKWVQPSTNQVYLTVSSECTFHVLTAAV